MSHVFRYFAFISYNSKDTEWGKRVQRKLEHYRLPATLCSEHGWKRTPIKPVFFAPTDIQPGGLTEEIQERLRASQHLIVICSPNSAQSEWVGREIEFFHNLGRTKQIHFFIVDGEPHSGNREKECFNPIVDELNLPEILGANIHEKIYRLPWLNKERAYVQLVSKLLGVEFDSIWKRHKRLLVQKIIAWIIGFLMIAISLCCVWINSQPIDVSISVMEKSVKNKNLPSIQNAVIELQLNNEIKIDTLKTLQESALFTNIPHRFLNELVHVSVSCEKCLNIDTTVVLTKDVSLNIFRDPTYYGNIRFRFWDYNNTVPHIKLSIEGFETIADENGEVTLFLPLEYQKESYRITTDVPLLSDLLVMPCGEDDVVIVLNK